MMKTFVFAIAVLFSSLFFTQTASATTLTVTYHGTVTLVQDPDGVFGDAYQEGDPITGSLTLSSIPDKPAFDHQEPGSTAQAFEAPGAWEAGNFSDNAPGSIHTVVFFPNSVSTNIAVLNIGEVGGVTHTNSLMTLTFGSADATTPQLLSFASFPKDKAALAAFWGGTLYAAEGLIFINTGGTAGEPRGQLNFDIQNVQFTVTPIPPSLVLFGSGLALLGMVRYRRSWSCRRRATAATSICRQNRATISGR